MQKIEIDLGARSYPIFIDGVLLGRVAENLPFDIQGRKAFIITDENVARYAPVLKDNLEKAGVGLCEVLVLPFGEGTKSFERFQECHKWMLSHGIHRNSVVFALGGGVIGDLAGFAASTVLRGVPYVQIPTSLLAQVDSSVGGKTGINTEYGKNLVGSFYQPAAVFADLDTLKTLPERQVLAGYAEIVKYGLLGDFEFFEWLEEHGRAVAALDREAIIEAVAQSCLAKAAIVEADEKEQGKRALLNLGHTFGHALEAAMGYDGRLLHGEGVAIGTVMAFDLSMRMGLCSGQDVRRVVQHFSQVGLPTHAGDIDANIDDLIETMRKDKKATDNTMVFILVRAIGDAFVSKDVQEPLVREVLKDSLHGKVFTG